MASSAPHTHAPVYGPPNGSGPPHTHQAGYLPALSSSPPHGRAAHIAPSGASSPGHYREVLYAPGVASSAPHQRAVQILPPRASGPPHLRLAAITEQGGNDLDCTGFASHKPTVAEFRRRVYIADGWGPMKRWDGRESSLQIAGFTGPPVDTGGWTPAPGTAPGDSVPGVHAFRYRYKDSRTGFVSNPSLEVEITVSAGGEQLTFPIDNSGAANIIRSTDSKVDTIILEATVAAGGEFFKAAEVPSSDASIVFNVDDGILEQFLLPYPEFDHNPPPIAKYVVSHRSHLWLFGQVVHEAGTLNFTNASANVGEGTTDPELSAAALGDPAQGLTKSVQWFIQKEGDSRVYEIDSYDEAGQQLVLTEPYVGVTTADANYIIYSTSNVIWVSSNGFPEGFNAEKFINGPNGERAGDITAGIGFGANMLFYSGESMFQVVWDIDPLSTTSPPLLYPLSDKYGALHQRVVIKVEGTAYALDRSGIQAFRGRFPEHISRPVDAFLKTLDYDNSECWHVAFFPELRAIRWFVSSNGDTYPQDFVQLDVDTGTWGTGRYNQGITSSALVPTLDGIRVIGGDANGHLWFLDEGDSDGSTGTTHATVSGSATQTVVPVTVGLPTAGEGLNGVIVKWVEGNEYALVTSNTSTALTLSGTGFSAAPAAGDTIWLGPIPCALKTKIFRPASIFDKTQPRKLAIAFEPNQSDRRLRVRSFDEHGVQQRYIEPQGNDLKGLVRPTVSTDDWQVRLDEADGVVEIPLGGEFRKGFSVELECEEPGTDVEISAMEISWNARRSHQ